jgi:NIMA (never in mitosis gene a)-related kinase
MDVILEKELTEETILDIFIQIVQAIQYIHSHNIVHRDMKPDNIFLMKERTVKIGDYGFARNIEASSMKITSAGTSHYISPKLVSFQQAGFPVDIWSIGFILYEMITKKPPFQAPTFPKFNKLILQLEPDPIRFNASDELKTLLAKLLNKFPQERITADEILNELLFLIFKKL